MKIRILFQEERDIDLWIDKTVPRVMPGEVIEVSDEQGEKLLEQPDNYEKVAAERPSKKASAKADPTKED